MQRWHKVVWIFVRSNLIRSMEGRAGQKRKANTLSALLVDAEKLKAKRRKSEKGKQKRESIDVEGKGEDVLYKNSINLSVLALRGLLDDSCLLFLKNNQTVAVQGKFKIKSLTGSTSILGNTLPSSDSFYKVFSPTSSNLLTIRDCSGADKDREKQFKAIQELLKTQDKDVSKAGTLKARKASSVLLLKKLDTTDTSFICQYKAYSDLFATDINKVASQETISSTVKKVHGITSQLGFLLYDSSHEPANMFHEPDEWQEVIKIISGIAQDKDLRRPCVLICGGKGVGKSSFARYMVNTLLNSCPEVCYLECDVGQTELTPPAILSLSKVASPLLGPPFTHQRWPERSFFFGDVTPRDNPKFYIQCVEDLQKFYLGNYADAPLVINTQGWVKGMGVPLLLDIIRITNPSHIIQISSSTQPSKNLPIITHDFLASSPGWLTPLPGDMVDQENAPARRDAFHDLITNLRSQNCSLEEEQGSSQELLKSCRTESHENPVIMQLESVASEDTQGQSFYSADYRSMSLLSYFSQMQDVLPTCTAHTPARDSPSLLTHYIPYKLPWKHVAVHVMHSEVPHSQVMMSLNASIVGLAVTPGSAVPDAHDGPAFLSKTPMAECLGLGILRNIDPVNKLFYVLTPVPLNTLQQVNTLLKGNLEIPAALWLQEAKPGAPYVSSEFSYDLKGAGARKVRYNLLRKKYNSPGKPIV